MIIDYRDEMNKLLDDIFINHTLNREIQKKTNILISWQINSNLNKGSIMEQKILHYGNLLTNVTAKVFGGSQSDKDLKWFKILTFWQNTQYGKIMRSKTKKHQIIDGWKVVNYLDVLTKLETEEVTDENIKIHVKLKEWEYNDYNELCEELKFREDTL